MSADNGIYILQSKDEFRVIEAQAIENVWYWGVFSNTPNQKLNPKCIYEYFGKSKVFNSEEEVWKEARKMYQNIMEGDLPILEYGINIISGWEDKDFPSS